MQRPALLLLVLFSSCVLACSSSKSDGTSSGGDDLPAVGGFGQTVTGGTPGGGEGSEGTGGPLPNTDLPPVAGEPAGEPSGQPTPSGECVDSDNDGYGANCVLGGDCDDDNPNFHDSCPDCAAQAFAGCPCAQDGQTSICYGDDPALNGIGACKVGERTCANGFWSGCIGEVLPVEETCDFVDNDCDGEVDEGVLSPCGNCDKFCAADEFGGGTDDPFTLGEANSEAVELTEEGWVTLDENSFGLHFIWIANTQDDTVSKLDTDTGLELGRYKVCNDPSRTSVDKNGDCWVGCREDGQVTKIANFVENCVDKNGNGVIETSVDSDGNGTITPDEILPAGTDECILFSVKPGSDNKIRAVGVDDENHAWVGLWNNKQLMRLSPVDGGVVQTVGIPANPYGLALDSKGIIWVAGRGGNLLVRVDPATGGVTQTAPSGCFEPYGITVDENDDVWIGNCCCGHVAWRYNPPSGAWTSVAVTSRPRGVAAGGTGFLYVANDESDRVAKIDLATLAVTGYGDLGASRFPVGIAVDSKGFVWAVNQTSNSVSKLDPTTLQVVHEQPVGSNPYTYSDMTGAAFFQDIAPEGFFRTVYGGWDGVRVKWESITIEYDAPPGTWIDLRVRTADTEDELEAAAWSDYLGPFPPNNFPVDLTATLKKKADFLDVEISLYSASGETKPYVKKVSIQYSAEPEG